MASKSVLLHWPNAARGEIDISLHSHFGAHKRGYISLPFSHNAMQTPFDTPGVILRLFNPG